VQPGLETVRGAAQRLRKSRLPPRGLVGFVSPKCAAACVAVLEPSCAGLTRASIEKAILSNRWIAGSSPAMTGGDVNGALNPLGFVSPKCAASVIISSGSRPAPRDKKPASVSRPGLMRSFGECSFLKDSRYASQVIFVTRSRPQTELVFRRSRRGEKATAGGNPRRDARPRIDRYRFHP
jgi:hypothetical protein